MKSVRRIISSKVGYLDSVYPGKKYDKIWFKVSNILDETASQVDEIIYHKTLDQLVYSLKINFNDGKR